jgi:hypothetical protein
VMGRGGSVRELLERGCPRAEGKANLSNRR